MTGFGSHHCSGCFCYIVPPHLLARIIEEGNAEEREAALLTLASSASLRTRRSLVTSLLREEGTRQPLLSFMAGAGADGPRSVHDAQHGGQASLPGQLVRSEGDPPSGDAAVDEAYDRSGTTRDFYKQVFNRNSLDDQGMGLVSSVHFGVSFDNAFWNGQQMVYGDGSGQFLVVGSLTELSVVSHELTHGVTEFTSGLDYHKQSGALNESFSDSIASLVKQYSLAQTADQADWLIGEGILVPSLGAALRSMKAPGTAFKFDNQPADMDHYVDLPDDNDPRHDNGGVHINSGIPNHAFYLAATAIGGNAWEAAGHIWYKAFTGLQHDADFKTAAQATVDVAGQDYPSDQDAVRQAWEQVGVL
jgi:Zn-dependent metalloprotease